LLTLECIFDIFIRSPMTIPLLLTPVILGNLVTIATKCNQRKNDTNYDRCAKQRQQPND